MRINDITEEIIGACIEIHRTLGPGLLESVYELCFAEELNFRKLKFARQHAVSIEYKGIKLSSELRIDFIVEGQVVVELKSVETLHNIHSVQLLTYLRLLNRRVGLLVNFNVPLLVDGIKRVVNDFNEK